VSHQDPTYVIFDGDNDMWAYKYMRGWNANKHIAFNFQDVHNLKPLREDAYLENTIKQRLKERFKITNQAIVLIGQHTKYLYKFVRWELESALELDLPIIAVNLNQKREYDPDLCPPILKDRISVVHVAFRARIIRYALDQFPSEYRNRPAGWEPNRIYFKHTYDSLGITD
jgi:hypothetical protein